MFTWYDLVKMVLILLDIKVKERNVDALMKGLDVFDPPRFMTVNQALEQLVEIEEKRGQNCIISLGNA